MINLFKKKPKLIGGYFGRLGLNDWWYSEFSRDEQDFIIEKLLHNLSWLNGENCFTEGSDGAFDGPPASTLANFSTHFSSAKTGHIAIKFILKAESFITNKFSLIDLHYFYSSKINIFYKSRDERPNALEIAIDACKKQIEIAPQVKVHLIKEFGREDIYHDGFKQLRIIEEKRGNYKTAIEIAKSALEQGWAGSWDRDIERIEKKMLKQLVKKTKL